jgi:hypothetical protein
MKKLSPAVRDAALRQLEANEGRCWCCEVWTLFVESLEAHRDAVIEQHVLQPSDETAWRLECANRDISLAEAPSPSPWFQ